MQTAEHRRAVAKARKERYAAEHRCVACGGRDERTLSGLHYCARCQAKHKAAARASWLKTHPPKEPAPPAPVSCLPVCEWMTAGELSCLDCQRPGGCKYDKDKEDDV